MIRVGRCKWERGKRIDPHFEDFTTCVSLTKSTTYGSLSPYMLKDSQGRILENVWQFSKVYQRVPDVTQARSRYDTTIIWRWPAETHASDIQFNEEGQAVSASLNSKYFNWRKSGMNAPEPIRYPVGYHHRHKCLFCLHEDVNDTNNADYQALTYIPSRKKLYLPMYVEAVVKAPQFKHLKAKLERGENVLIAEVDGPHQESLDYYIKEYGVSEDFIQDDTMLATYENLNIMLEDPKHPFGHGYCLALALLGYNNGI